MFSRSLCFAPCVILACGALACVSRADAPGSPTGSEVAVSAVSGALNNNSGSSVAFAPAVRPKGTFERALDVLNPVATAYAAEWSCSGATLTPTFNGPGADPYSFTPASCQVTWMNGATASSVWSGPFKLDYGASCNSTSPLVDGQSAGCTLTRTAPQGDTRTITGPDGNSYAILHDTDGAGTGWDSSISVNNDGVVVTCGGSGCAAERTVVVNGSHLTGTVDFAGNSIKIWDHTVSTGAGGVTVTGTGSSRVASGTVIVQHNLIHEVSTTTFNSVGYGDPVCCFPTSGAVTTTFSAGLDAGKTESIAFSGTCGEATLTKTSGAREALTLIHCL